MRPALGDKFLDLSPKAQPTKENINYSPSSKLKTCVVRDPVKRRKRQATKWEKHLHKELSKLNNKNPIGKWAKEINRHFTKEYIQITK